MKRMELKNSDSCQWQSHVAPGNSQWLAKNISEMDQSVKQMLQLIEQDDESLTKKDPMHYQQKPELIAGVEEFYRIYLSLAERYDHLTKQNVTSEFQMQGSGNSGWGSDNSSPLATPDEKLGQHKSAHLSASFSSSGGSSDPSLKEGTESSLSSDSDSESFNSSVNSILGSVMDRSSRGLDWKMVESGAEFPCLKGKLQGADKANGYNNLDADEQGNYEEAVGRVIKYKEELRDSNLKLQLLEQEVSRLKSELQKSDSVIALAENARTQLESAQGVIKMRETDLDVERRKGFELRKQVVELETVMSDFNSKIQKLVEELEVSREQLKGSDEEISKLKHELGKEMSKGTQVQGQLKLAQDDIATLETQLDSERRQVMDLEESTVRYQAYISERDHEVKQLKVASADAWRNFSVEKAKMQSDITNLLEKQTLLEARLIEWELISKSLKEEMNKCNAETMEMKALHDIQEGRWQAEINRLKAELAARDEYVEALNKNLDGLQVKYDMLMAEKDGVDAKLDTVRADLRSRNLQIGQTEEHLSQLQGKNWELSSESESAKKLVEKFKQRLEETEKEVDRQRIMILDKAEEKREAIRQLCFSLDHYKSGYRELCQAFLGHKGHAVMSS